MGLHATVSAGMGLIALTAAVLIYFFGNHTPRLMALLVMTGMTGMVGTPFGRWARELIDWADRLLNNLTARWFGATVAGLLAGALVYVFVVRMKNKQVDKVTLGTAAFAPVAVATIPGPVGVAAYTAITAVAGAIAWAIGQAFGLA